MIIIGLLGRKRSGKDTVASLLREHMPALTVRRIAFADPLKQMVSEWTGITVEEAELDRNRWRPVWQLIGTDIMRHYHGDDYWIKKAKAEIASNSADVVVLTDCRFPNEAKLIKEMGGFLIRVSRPEKSWLKRLISKFKREHVSETAADHVEADFNIVNDGSLDDLRRKTAHFGEFFSSQWLVESAAAA